MYKTAVYTLVNGGILHIKNRKYQKMWHYAAWNCL